MKVFGLTTVIIAISLLMHQINIFTINGIEIIEDSVSYIVEGTKSGWKYSLSFIENSHENKLDKIRKEKEKKELQRKIRIETIENELEEGKTIIDKSMPNYRNLLVMFGNELPKQYELACEIVMMKETLFVSESLQTLARIVKNETGKKLEKMNIKIIVDKMIEKEIYMETMIMLYEQQLKNTYLIDSRFRGDTNVEQSIIVLDHAIGNYEASWNMNVANELFKNAQNEISNLSYIDYTIIPQRMSNLLPLYTTENNNKKRDEDKYVHSTKYNHVNPDNENNDDPKCKNKPYNHDNDGIWKKYNKY